MTRVIMGFCEIHGRTRLIKKKSDYPFIIGESRFICLKCKENSVKVIK